ncbi:MAG: hypothetical protein DRR08_07830 [Candidatus Parabeggiatoa sp. nov. 2]|nr:MAG: hypothetical protein B6247_02480 [Beggiatoa sp. 4572_84]RKZ61780.1 MAG: hypothetical protein DRR08_07830 [Gammaproteobacteria bacterium]
MSHPDDPFDRRELLLSTPKISPKVEMTFSAVSTFKISPKVEMTFSAVSTFKISPKVEMTKAQSQRPRFLLKSK